MELTGSELLSTCDVMHFETNFKMASNETCIKTTFEAQDRSKVFILCLKFVLIYLVLVLKVFTDIYFGKLKISTLFRIGIAECK